MSNESATPDWPRICTECGFDLRRVSSRAACPECGAACDPQAIVISLRSRESWLIGSGLTAAAALFLLAVCVLMALAGVRRGSVFYTAAFGVGALVALQLLFRVRLRRRPHLAVILFGADGVSERSLGTWTSVMPYAELDAFDLGPPSRGGRRKLRVRMSYHGVELAWGRGTVELSNAEAHVVVEEVRRRIRTAREAASALTSSRE